MQRGIMVYDGAPKVPLELKRRHPLAEVRFYTSRSGTGQSYYDTRMGQPALFLDPYNAPDTFYLPGEEVPDVDLHGGQTQADAEVGLRGSGEVVSDLGPDTREAGDLGSNEVGAGGEHLGSDGGENQVEGAGEAVPALAEGHDLVDVEQEGEKPGEVADPA